MNFFCYPLRLRRYERKSVEVSLFRRGWVTFGEYFGWKRKIPSKPCWSGKTRDIAVSYGVEISTDDYFVLSQYMHLTDIRWMDRQTELRQQYRALHYMQSHGNNQISGQPGWHKS